MTPSQEAFTAQERTIVCQQKTAYKVQRFLNALPYNDEKKKETLRTFRGVVGQRSAHCLEAALSAAGQALSHRLHELAIHPGSSAVGEDNRL